MDAGDKEAREKVKDLRRSIKDCKSFEDEDLSIWGEVIEALDKHAKTAFQAIDAPIGEMAPGYITPLSTYQQDVIQTLQDTWGLNAHAKPGDVDNIKHLDKVVARVALFLTPEEGDIHAPEPLLGGFIMDYAWACFTKIELGIGELCRWFEALLDSWHVLHPKTHTMDDWSSVMLSNIRQDPRFSSGENTTQAVVHIIWLYRDSLMMRLTNKIEQGKRKYKPRPTDKKALESAYEKLSTSEQIACDALLALVNKKRGKNAVHSRDFSIEPLSIAGMMVLHTTA
ncbi:hypothetical protein BDR05DRAFT_1007067, partial [Suillus weaverae]